MCRLGLLLLRTWLFVTVCCLWFAEVLGLFRTASLFLFDCGFGFGGRLGLKFRTMFCCYCFGLLFLARHLFVFCCCYCLVFFALVCVLMFCEVFWFGSDLLVEVCCLVVGCCYWCYCLLFVWF